MNAARDKTGVVDLVAGGYHKFALRMREHSKVSGVLKLARSALEIKPDELDANPFEINIVDL